MVMNFRWHKGLNLEYKNNSSISTRQIWFGGLLISQKSVNKFIKAIIGYNANSLNSFFLFSLLNLISFIKALRKN